MPSVPSTPLHPQRPPARTEPGQGLEKDKNVTQFVKDRNIGGAMIWAANPSPKTNPRGAKLCPQTADALKNILQPTYAWGPPPRYTKCDPSTGYLSASQVDATLARFVAVEEDTTLVEASSRHRHAPVAPQCCWSAWGDEAACGGYLTGSSGGACNTDWAKACIADGDCPTAPPVLVPTLPGPTPGPDTPSASTPALRHSHRELSEY